MAKAPLTQALPVANGCFAINGGFDGTGGCQEVAHRGVFALVQPQVGGLAAAGQSNVCRNQWKDERGERKREGKKQRKKE